jgi:hypothetical protein
MSIVRRSMYPCTDESVRYAEREHFSEVSTFPVRINLTDGTECAIGNRAILTHAGTIRPLHTHILKHTCGMATISRGIEYTRQYLGHKSISSTGAY